jgi:predicted CxxxxCH...CXXCH cytochrome family protein
VLPSVARLDRAGRLAFASFLLLAAAACGRDRAPTQTASAAGQPGISFVVTVSRPTHGTVTSADGMIACGSAPASGACSGSFPWSAIVILTATPDAGYAFETWAGDCQLTGPCTLSTAKAGADKFVVASFALASEVGHGYFMSPTTHGPAFFAYQDGVPGSPQCPNCHGPNLVGQGIAPGCDGCHAQAGWASWRTSCSFCHGARNASTKAGYDLAAHPAWAAPPDAVAQRLSGAAAPERTGAHQAHLSGESGGQAVSAPFACGTCHPVPPDYRHARGVRAIVTLSGAGQAQLPAALGSYDAVAGTCAVYCHGAAASPRWDATGVGCTSCHGAPPAPDTGHPAVSSDLRTCVGCHPAAMNADGTVDAAGGKHVNGAVDVVGCGTCHGNPPATGAHLAHFGLDGSGAYGDVRALQDRFPGAVPADAPGVYAFGCGLCHPTDAAKHRDGTMQVEVRGTGATTGSLRARARPDATFDAATGRCSGVYCHSSGQEAPAFAETPDWRGNEKVGCAGCHANPPRYASGGAGTATANGHLGFADDLWESGHFLGLLGPWHTSKHGGNWSAVEDAAPITCQTCHADTTDPTATGPSGFYWLDTTGDYVLPGGDASRIAYGYLEDLRCTTCHGPTGPATAGAGRVLPLRHVNGARDVVFDARTSLPPIAWLPQGAAGPVAPYWMTGGDAGIPDWPATVSWSGTTVSFSLDGASYDAATKTCTSVACHMAESPRWGSQNGYVACSNCHPSF